MWTLEHIERLAKEGKICGYKLLGGKEVKTVPVKLKKEPTGLQFIKKQLDTASIPFVTEYRFHQVRKFRFDIALPVLNIAIEYEGLVSKKSRHTSITGYTRDAEKYNLAQREGWRVYRYTALNYKDFENDLKTIFNERP